MASWMRGSSPRMTRRGSSIKRRPSPLDAIQILRHPRDDAAELCKRRRIDALGALVIHPLRDLQEPVTQPPRLRRQMNPGDALVVDATDPADQSGLFHAAERDDGGRLHHAD